MHSRVPCPGTSWYDPVGGGSDKLVGGRGGGSDKLVGGRGGAVISLWGVEGGAVISF